MAETGGRTCAECVHFKSAQYFGGQCNDPAKQIKRGLNSRDAIVFVSRADTCSQWAESAALVSALAACDMTLAEFRATRAKRDGKPSNEAA